MVTGPVSAEGPPPTVKGQATRERIVRAAADLMFANRVAGTSTPAIRDAAGVSSSQIYHYFTDKQALTREVIAYRTRMIIGMHAELLAELDSVAGLRAWRDVVVRTVREYDCVGGCPLGSLSSELAEHDPDARAALAESFTLWSIAIRAGLRRLVERAVLRTDADPDRLALAMLAALQGGLLLAQAQRDTIALEVALDTMIERIEQHATAPRRR